MLAFGCDSEKATETPTPQPVEIVIYTDFQCPRCERLHSLVEGELEQLYVDTGKAFLDVRPLSSKGGPDSMRAAEAALCAADQGKFGEYRDAIFAAWRQRGPAAYSEEELKRTAGELGLNQEAFATCLESGAKRAQVEANLDSALNAGATGVPAVLIDGTIIHGNQTLQTYVEPIEELLAR